MQSSSFASSDRCFVIVESQRVFLGGGPALLCVFSACVVGACVAGSWSCAPVFLAPVFLYVHFISEVGGVRVANPVTEKSISVSVAFALRV